MHYNHIKKARMIWIEWISESKSPSTERDVGQVINIQSVHNTSATLIKQNFKEIRF